MGRMMEFENIFSLALVQSYTKKVGGNEPFQNAGDQNEGRLPKETVHCNNGGLQ